jgi:Ca2+-binding EF-hand superfamily protein
MSHGLNLRLSDANIKDLFLQADTDKDGYITFLDALRFAAFRC